MVSLVLALEELLTGTLQQEMFQIDPFLNAKNP